MNESQFSWSDPYILFDRLNSLKANNPMEQHSHYGSKTEILDKNEVAKAKELGFSLFDLKADMTEKEFFHAYNEVLKRQIEEENEEAFIQKEKMVHVKFLQQKYDMPNIQPEENETMEEFESRLYDLARMSNIYDNGRPNMGL